ncbi:MAG: DedA family protein [Alcaligenaceae bacterium]
MPSVGLGALFVVSALAATILPLGSEPIFLGYLALQPEFFWMAVVVATAGNSLGGFTTYWMGAGAHLAFQRWRPKQSGASGSPESPGGGQLEANASPAGTAARSSVQQTRAQAWVQRFGAPILLLSWLPVVGDPLCAMAGWLRLPWLSCLIFMMIGKCARYLVLGGVLQLLLP